MKLSKKQLEDFIVGAISDCEEYGLSDKQERAALESLRNGTLEIEGYKQMKDVDSIDGKPLSEGEVALIRAIRRGTRLIDPLRQIDKEKEARNETK